MGIERAAMKCRHGPEESILAQCSIHGIKAEFDMGSGLPLLINATQQLDSPLRFFQPSIATLQVTNAALECSQCLGQIQFSILQTTHGVFQGGQGLLEGQFLVWLCL
jgi:hypothetical protein